MLVCPRCSHINPDLIDKCMYCGALLSGGGGVKDNIKAIHGKNSYSRALIGPRRTRKDGDIKPVPGRAGGFIKRTVNRRIVLLAITACLILGALIGYHQAVQADNTRPVKIFTPDLDYSDQAPVIDLSSEAVVLMEADTGAVLYARNPDKRLPPASTTKLMTLLLTIKAMEKGEVGKDDLVTISENAWKADGSQIYLEPGETISLDNLLKATAVKSANDAAVAIAEWTAGSQEAFVRAMNDEARELGMKNTHFANVNGLPVEDHYTSARDMALLGREAVKHKQIFDYTSIKSCKIPGREFTLFNTNKLLWWYDGVDGLKTGWTSEAKNCVVATAERGGMRLIAAVFASPHPRGQFYDAMKLFDYGFASYSFPSMAERGQVCGKVKVWLGKEDYVDVVASEDAGFITNKGKESEVTFASHLEKNIVAPVQKGEKLGYIDVFWQGKLVKQVDLIAASGVPGILQ